MKERHQDGVGFVRTHMDIDLLADYQPHNHETPRTADFQHYSTDNIPETTNLEETLGMLCTACIGDSRKTGDFPCKTTFEVPKYSGFESNNYDSISNKHAHTTKPKECGISGNCFNAQNDGYSNEIKLPKLELQCNEFKNCPDSQSTVQTNVRRKLRGQTTTDRFLNKSDNALHSKTSNNMSCRTEKIVQHSNKENITKSCHRSLPSNRCSIVAVPSKTTEMLPPSGHTHQGGDTDFSENRHVSRSRTKSAGRLPQVPEELLQRHFDKDRHFSPRWRTGVDAYNDKEQFSKAFQASRAHEVEVVLRLPRFTGQRFARKSNTTGGEDDIKAPKLSLHKPSTIHTDTEKGSSLVDGQLSNKTKSSTDTDRKHDVAKRRFHFADIVDEAMDQHHRPHTCCRSMQRRGALLSDVDKISFVLTFQFAFSQGNCPSYIIEGYRRASESIRFNVPCDLSSLESMTPLEYLSRHTRVDSGLKNSYNKGFLMFKKKYESLTDNDQRDEVKKCLFLAMDRVFYKKLGKSNFDKVHSVVMVDEDLGKLTLKDFIGFCSLTERCFWRMFDSVNENKDTHIGCRPHIEYLDFCLVIKRQDELKLTLRMKVLLASLA